MSWQRQYSGRQAPSTGRMRVVGSARAARLDSAGETNLPYQGRREIWRDARFTKHASHSPFQSPFWQCIFTKRVPTRYQLVCTRRLYQSTDSSTQLCTRAVVQCTSSFGGPPALPCVVAYLYCMRAGGDMPLLQSALMSCCVLYRLLPLHN